MSEISGFFPYVNGGNEYDGKFLAKWIGSIISDGVFNGALVVTPGGNMQIVIKPGMAWQGPDGERYFYKNTTDLTISIENADGVLNRIDTVVLRYDANNFKTNVIILKGEFSSVPVAPSIRRTAEQYDLKLAEINISAGTIAISQSAITDTRLDSSVCGIIHAAVDHIDTTTLFNQLQAYITEHEAQFAADMTNFKNQSADAFNTWFQGLKDVLDENTATNLLNLINTHTQNTGIHVDETSKAAWNAGIVTTYIHTKIGTAHSLSGSGTNGKFKANGNFTEGDTIAVNGIAVTAKLQNGDTPSSDFFKVGNWVQFIYDDVLKQLNFSSGGGKAVVPNYAAKVIVHVATSDSGSVGSTRVRIRNEQLGANYIQTLDALGNTTFDLLENHTYYVVLLDYPTTYYGGAAIVTAVGGATQTVTITLKTEPDTIGWRENITTGAVEYTDGATAFLPATMGSTFDGGSWAQSWLFRNIKPCMLKNGVVQYYLNPNDYTKKVDGTAADITSGTDGDVMIEIPLVYYKFSADANYIYCQFSLIAQDGYCANAFLSASGVPQQTMYMAAYDGYSLSSKLRSLSGYAPTVNQTIGAFRTLATANGAGYQQHEWSKRALLQAMFVMMFKGLDSQTLLGKGVTSASAAANTGTMNTKGMYWGDQTGTNGVKFCGIEHFWGNIYKFCDGLELVTNVYKYKIYAPYNDTASSYLDSAKSAPTGNYIQSMNSGNGYGMIPATTASAGIFADYMDKTASGTTICFVGGYWSSGTYAGLFYVSLYYAASSTYAYIGAALSFTPQ